MNMEHKMLEALQSQRFCKKLNDNTFNFIPEGEQPEWSRLLDEYWLSQAQKPDMPKRYTAACEEASKSSVLKKYFSFITEKGGIIVDLASGPSGYFAPAFDLLKETDLFIAADGIKTILEAHAAANKENPNFMAVCIDLDKPLPFRDNSIDVMCGNLLDNVEGYKDLIREIYRCLKPGGRYGVIDLFYEEGSQTFAYLSEKNAVYSSFNYYVSFCREAGFHFLESQLMKTIKGKLQQEDFLPICEDDVAEMRTIFFEKK